ncbi:HNH endonuclease [Methyloradius palustris]|uniref:HNH nuclease domain-containing protein n=1 Tax=Methyloradius palustris TaxID=2778876 RepID=A0A8D5K1F8_9PROT|nr:HNH endonuclease signature motif containing protein [Methyloradius palustris]BCM25723.1 hypothetical protein ZMTM_19820 [Methyloradius palustris]
MITSSVLDELKPTNAINVIELVAEAGIDISNWGYTNDGRVVKNPASNPAYSFEWAFGGEGNPSLVCVWHSSLEMIDGQIEYEDNLRDFALSLDRIAIDQTKPRDVKSRARQQAKRARRFDSVLQRAFRTNQPVRVIILEGKTRSKSEVGVDRSEVDFRKLDTAFWYMHSYDDSGSIRLVRNVLPLSDEPDVNTDIAADSLNNIQYIDQFTSPKKLEAVGSVFVRSALVRDVVLKRAKGVCEYCGEQGFKTASDSIYLETHHVVPLSENGADEEWNVVAICPNDHRKAHYADNQKEMRKTLLEFLIELHPKVSIELFKF